MNASCVPAVRLHVRRFGGIPTNSLVQQVIMPFEASGCRVDLFLTVYDTLNPELRDELTRLYSPRVLAVTTVHERGSSQVCRNCEVLISFTPRLCE